MINDDFYPTPPEVIDLMVRPLIQAYNHPKSLMRRNILEPSAGKGDILDRLTEIYSVQKRNVIACEIEMELRLILAGKEYQVVEADFLKYQEHYPIDLIVMNPPFSAGAKHLLKAWDILPHGDIICLLNAETLRNPYTDERKLLLSIIEQHGRYEEIGAVFKNAERPTGVACAIVWLTKPQVETTVKFDNLNLAQDSIGEGDDFSASPLASADIIEALVNQYNHAVSLLLKRQALQKEFAFYTKGIVSDTYVPMLKVHKLAESLDGLKEQFWQYVFQKTGIGQKVPSHFKRKFEEFKAHNVRMAFTYDNIMAIFDHFLANSETLMDETITNVFDQATKYYKGNRDHTEGWVHNKSWKMAKKIIMPYTESVGDFRWLKREFFDDLDKVLCFLSGRRFSDPDFVSFVDAYEKQKWGYGQAFESTFYRIRVYQKGTVHLTFKDLDLLARFNVAAAKGKKWVGAGV